LSEAFSLVVRILIVQLQSHQCSFELLRSMIDVGRGTPPMSRMQ